MRGKSGLVYKLEEVFRNRGLKVLAKVTGKTPLILYNGREIPIERKEEKHFFIDDENRKIIKKYGDRVDIMIFENQAISKYTIKVFHEIFKPDVIIVPNVRYEHLEGMGDTIEEIAESFAVHFKDAKVIINAELNASVRKIFERYAKKYGRLLINVDHKLDIMSEQIPIINALLDWLQFEQLTERERKEIKKEIDEDTKIKYSRKVGIWYLDASKVNDVDSTKLFFKRLMRQTDRPIVVTSYFRGDRIDRTYAFRDILQKWSKNKRIIKMYFGGYYYDVIFKNCKKHKDVERVTINDIEKIIDFTKERGAVLLLAVNGVNEFMMRMREVIEE